MSKDKSKLGDMDSEKENIMEFYKEMRTVLLVNIEDGTGAASMFLEMYSGLLKLLTKNPFINLVTVTSIRELTARVMKNIPKIDVLLFTDELIYSKRQSKLVDMVLLPFLNGGGLAILAGQFANFDRFDPMHDFFKALGLSWRLQALYKATFYITPTGRKLLSGINGFPLVQNEIEVKSAQIARLKKGEGIYIFPADSKLAMSALGRIGKGAIAYVGDITADESTNRLTAALCLVKY